MKILTEKKVNTDSYAGTVDLITGIDDFKESVTYDDEWHTYRLNGKIIPSVTSMLDNGEYLNVKKDILEYAQTKGTIVHEEIESWWKTKEKGFTSEFYEFLRLYEENKKIFEQKCVFDYKTYSTNSKDKREKCYKQIKMYADAIKYLTGEVIDNYYMIWLPHNKKGKIINLKNEFERDEKNV